MNVKEAIRVRRAYRSLAPVKISEETVHDLAEHAGLSPSCFNKQPWRFVFAYNKEVLTRLFDALSKGNAWAQAGSLVVAVFSEKESACLVNGREYFLFDTGLAAGFLMLRAAEMGLVAHPIAGFDEDRVKEILSIPRQMTVITLIIVGKKSQHIGPLLSEKQAAAEEQRPPRLDFAEFAYIDTYSREGQ